jgi:DNA-binding transcriptional regulator YdaS (Cro superfamily)
MNLRTYLDQERGRASKLARILSVSPVTVHQWGGGKKVPTARCIEIEEATKGAVTCEELRPDLSRHWAVLRGSSSRRGAKQEIDDGQSALPFSANEQERGAA